MLSVATEMCQNAGDDFATMSWPGAIVAVALIIAFAFVIKWMWLGR